MRIRHPFLPLLFWMLVGGLIGNLFLLAARNAFPALPNPMPADGPVAKALIGDDQNARSMNFKSIAPSTNFEAADLIGPAPDPRIERHGEILREWSELRIVGPHECCGDVVSWNGLRLVAEFMRGAKR